MSETASEADGEIDREIPASLSALYQEVILDHYRRPRNKGALEDATHHVTLNNPLCGDIIELMLKVEDGRIADVGFAGKGCSISQASVSMMTTRLKGREIPDARELSDKFTRLLHGHEELLEDADLGDLRALAGVSRFPVRIKCALLGWNCLGDLIDEDDGSSAADGADPE